MSKQYREFLPVAGVAMAAAVTLAGLNKGEKSEQEWFEREQRMAAEQENLNNAQSIVYQKISEETCKKLHAACDNGKGQKPVDCEEIAQSCKQ